MGVMVIACYRPKPGKDAQLAELVREHLDVLRAEHLVAEAPRLAGRAEDGTIVEVFVWASQAAIDAAHGNAAVSDLWRRFAAVCDYVPIAQVPGAEQLFSPFEHIVLDQGGVRD